MEPLKGLTQWVKKRSKEHFGSPRDILVVGDMNVPSRDSELFRMLKRNKLRLPKALAELKGNKATTNLARKAPYDQILHYATDPERFTDHAGVLDFFMEDYKSLYPELTKKLDFTFEMSDHLPVWIQLDTWIEDERLVTQVS